MKFRIKLTDVCAFGYIHAAMCMRVFMCVCAFAHFIVLKLIRYSPFSSLVKITHTLSLSLAQFLRVLFFHFIFDYFFLSRQFCCLFVFMQC